MIVHRDSWLNSFSELRGASWVYNEPSSFSGYASMRYHLAAHGEDGRFFGRITQSGAHSISLQMVLDRQVDCAVIDSTVLEQLVENQPDICQQIRIVDVIGPSPIPPLVATSSLDVGTRTRMRELLLAMHEDQGGRAILQRTPIARFAGVTDQDYDSMRRMLEMAETVGL